MNWLQQRTLGMVEQFAVRNEAYSMRLSSFAGTDYDDSNGTDYEALQPAFVSIFRTDASK
jgi:hypothetical protein